MSDSKSCTIRTRKFLTNRLLYRKQFVRRRVALGGGLRVRALRDVGIM